MKKDIRLLLSLFVMTVIAYLLHFVVIRLQVKKA